MSPEEEWRQPLFDVLQAPPGLVDDDWRSDTQTYKERLRHFAVVKQRCNDDDLTMFLFLGQTSPI